MTENEKPKLAIVDDLKLAQELMQLFDALKNEDSDGDGTPDYLELVGIAKSAITELNTFKTELPGMTVANAIPEIQAFLTKMDALYVQAQALLGKDIADLKAKFPNLIPSI